VRAQGHIDTDALTQTQQQYLQAGRENLSYAGDQAALLGRLSMRHGGAIARQQADAARAAVTALQELAPRFLVPGRQARPPSHDVHTFPQVQEAINRAKMGGYAEGIIRMLVLLARARGSVRRDRLERSDRLLHARPPFNSMTAETRRRLIQEQSVIAEFCGDEAITTLADILRDPVDRYRALNLVMDVAGPMEELSAPTIAMFKRFQAALLTLAREWRDPDLDRNALAPDSGAHGAPATEPAATPEGAAAADAGQESAA
jgi:hypothetical protein